MSERPMCPMHGTEMVRDVTEQESHPWLSWWCPACNEGHPMLDAPPTPEPAPRCKACEEERRPGKATCERHDWLEARPEPAPETERCDGKGHVVDGIDESSGQATWHWCKGCPACKPAPEAPRIDGVWRCSECGEALDPTDGKWRWTGEAWQHSHGYPVGHVEARYFGQPAPEAPKACGNPRCRIETGNVTHGVCRECLPQYRAAHKPAPVYCDLPDYAVDSKKRADLIRRMRGAPITTEAASEMARPGADYATAPPVAGEKPAGTDAGSAGAPGLAASPEAASARVWDDEDQQLASDPFGEIAARDREITALRERLTATEQGEADALELMGRIAHAVGYLAKPIPNPLPPLDEFIAAKLTALREQRAQREAALREIAEADPCKTTTARLVLRARRELEAK